MNDIFKCPTIDALLEDWSDGDEIWIEKFWMMIGHCICLDQSPRKLFIFYGASRTGKTAASELLGYFMPVRRMNGYVSRSLKSCIAAPTSTMKYWGGRGLCLIPDLYSESELVKDMASDASRLIKLLRQNTTYPFHVENVHRSNLLAITNILDTIPRANSTKFHSALLPYVEIFNFDREVPIEKRCCGIEWHKIAMERAGAIIKAVQARVRLFNRCDEILLTDTEKILRWGTRSAQKNDTEQRRVCDR